MSKKKTPIVRQVNGLKVGDTFTWDGHIKTQDIDFIVTWFPNRKTVCGKDPYSNLTVKVSIKSIESEHFK